MVEPESKMQWTEPGGVLYIDSRLLGCQQQAETGRFVCCLYRSVVGRRTVTPTRSIQLVHFTACGDHNNQSFKSVGRSIGTFIH